MRVLIKRKVVENKKKIIYILGGCALSVGVFIIVFVAGKNNVEQYMANNGVIELTEIASAYIVKDEQVVKKDSGKSILPSIAEGQRVSLEGIIATYKNNEYTAYVEKLEKLDKEILELMKDLPEVYSGETQSIQNQIKSEIKKSVGITSYVEAQNYLHTVNSLINKRALIIGESSPAGSAVKTLIAERNEYALSAQTTNDNIVAPISGIVSYKTDGLETIINTSQINELNYDKIQNLMVNNKVGSDIKIVDNFLAYIIMEVPKDNKEFIKINSSYVLRMLDGNYEFTAKLIDYENTDNGKVSLKFEITNGIENLLNVRHTEFELVWWAKSGLYVPNEALYKYESVDAYYVQIIKYGEYSEVPVTVKAQNSSYSIIDNYSQEDLTSLGLTRQYQLKLYDRLIVER